MIVILGYCSPHYAKYQNFKEFSVAEILRKSTVSYGNSTETLFAQNFHTRKLGEISVIYAVPVM